MNSIDRVIEAYSQTDRGLTCLLEQDSRHAFDETAEDAGAASIRDKEYWDGISEINEQSYIVMVFAQFDDYVSRQILDIEGTEDVEEPRRLFMEKITVLLGKTSPLLPRIQKRYTLRCDIAHGRYEKSGRIGIHAIRNDLKEFIRAIEKSMRMYGPEK